MLLFVSVGGEAEAAGCALANDPDLAGRVVEDELGGLAHIEVAGEGAFGDTEDDDVGVSLARLIDDRLAGFSGLEEFGADLVALGAGNLFGVAEDLFAAAGVAIELGVEGEGANDFDDVDGVDPGFARHCDDAGEG